MDKQSKRQTIQAKVKPALVSLDLPGRNFWHARIESERAFDPFRYSLQTEVLPIGTDDLNAQGQAVFAETRRQRERGRAEQGPWRAIFGVAGRAETFRGFAERRNGQDRI